MQQAHDACKSQPYLVFYACIYKWATFYEAIRQRIDKESISAMHSVAGKLQFATPRRAHKA